MSRIINISRQNRRIICISDIHGGLSIFEQLLKQVDLRDEDILIVLGDFLQRGYDNIQTLSYIRDLVLRPHTYVLSGNHEHYLCSLLEEQHLDRLEYHMAYIHYGCILREWMATYDIQYDSLMDLQGHVKVQCQSDLDFLKNLPYALVTEDYVFVHGGMKENLENSETWDLLSTPEFLWQGHTMSETVVVGHWPVQNYKKDSFSGQPIMDYDQRIIAIDGGYGIKDSGQINALIIDDSVTYLGLDELPLGVLNKNVQGHETNIVKLDYQDRAFELLTKGESLSLVKKTSTGEVLSLINHYLDHPFEDYISRFLSGQKGDVCKIVKTAGPYTLVKRQGEVGWIKSSHLDVQG